MANPNIASLSAIYGNNSLTNLTTTNATSIASNAASSGKVFKINSIIVANVDGSTAYDITISVYSAAALGGTAFQIASTVTVPADASVIVLDRNTAIYLKEDQSIGATAGTANKLKVVASWEEIN
jgi:hypothetical protein